MFGLASRLLAPGNDSSGNGLRNDAGEQDGIMRTCKKRSHFEGPVCSSSERRSGRQSQSNGQIACITPGPPPVVRLAATDQSRVPKADLAQPKETRSEFIIVIIFSIFKLLF